MAGASEECVVEEVEEGRGKRGLSGSMSLRTRKLGRRLSRSMSIVALKLPEKAHSITRSSSKLMKSGSRDKKNRSFELSIILPDKTQKQVTVWGNNTVAEVVCDPLQSAGAVIAGVPSGPLSAPLHVPLGSPLPPPAPLDAPPVALLFLGGSKAPVEPRSPASSLEGEVLVVEYQPPTWDGKDLDTFIAWEKIYASTLFSAIELYGKPLLRAAVISKEEYHLLFYYLEAVSEASEALTLRMRKYMDSGLLINECQPDVDNQSVKSRKSLNDEQSEMLNELIQEGVITQRDVDVSSEITSSVYETSIDYKNDDSDNRSSLSSNSNLRKVIVDIPIDCNESMTGSGNSIVGSNDVTTINVKSGAQCCRDHRLSADVTDNVWATVKWEFINPADFGYDQVRNVKRSRSESAITPVPRKRNDEIYETLDGQDRESVCESITPYESIEDLYNCIKNAHYSNTETEESTPSTEHNEPQFNNYYEKQIATRQSSASSERSSSSAFMFSKCGSSVLTGEFASCESTSGVSTFATTSLPDSLKCRELPEPPVDDKTSESAILLKQLFMGELMDAYGEYLSAYPFARALLRRKARRDEHFIALADIRRGAAKYTIADYLELPVSARM